MSTTKQEFKDLASELFDEFDDFAPARRFSKPGTGGTFNPITGETTGGTGDVFELVPAIREDYEAKQFNGQSIQVGDLKLLARFGSFNVISPRAEGVKVVVDGVDYQIITVDLDAADAVYTLQVRKL